MSVYGLLCKFSSLLGGKPLVMSTPTKCVLTTYLWFRHPTPSTTPDPIDVLGSCEGLCLMKVYVNVFPL